MDLILESTPYLHQGNGADAKPFSINKTYDATAHTTYVGCRG